MLVENFLTEDKYGYFLDARDVPYNRLNMNDIYVIKITLLSKDWYCISQFAKAISIKTNSKQLAKKLNKINDGTAVRIRLFGQKLMWFATDDGLHQIIDDSLSINQLNIAL